MSGERFGHSRCMKWLTVSSTCCYWNEHGQRIQEHLGTPQALATSAWCAIAYLQAHEGRSRTGSGMPPDLLTRVFEAFFTTKDVGKSTGLGLAMVHGYTDQAGGRIKIDSRVGEGASVTIVLARRRAESAADLGKENSRYDASPGSPSRLGSRRCLTTPC